MGDEPVKELTTEWTLSLLVTLTMPHSDLSINMLSTVSSGRKSTMDKKLSITMISGPQNDMRHTGHVGCDGTTFGDVAFIVDNFDKLPKKPQTPGECGSFPRQIAISPVIVMSVVIFVDFGKKNLFSSFISSTSIFHIWGPLNLCFFYLY